MSGHWSRSFLIQDKSHEGSVQWLAGACPPADFYFQVFFFCRRAFCGNRLRTGAPPQTPPLRGAFLAFFVPLEKSQKGREERRREGEEREGGEKGKERGTKARGSPMENRGFDPRTSRMLNGRSTN